MPTALIVPGESKVQYEGGRVNLGHQRAPRQPRPYRSRAVLV